VEPQDIDAELDTLSVLADPVRRAAYRVVAAASVPAGRDDVAGELGIGRTLAAHHLDRLVEAGLLAVSYARRSGRTGPGAGRPAKLYSRAPGEHAASVPPRAYGAAAELLAEAVDRSGADDSLYEVARARGRAAGAAARSTAAGRAEVIAALARQGYEPEVDGSVIRLRNCPFHRLAEQFPPLVCGMNLALLDGLLDGLGADATARLDPTPRHCCVVLDISNDNDD
jgi:predicted ArsR family transcriptional regulator